MGDTMTTSVARQIEALFGGGSVAGLTDRQLIERFVTGRDPLAAEAAFAALVARHGPMVLGVCRQIVGDHQHAEDAFQAVFLVLARKARSIRDPDRLSQWLHGVALRTARKARGRLARIRRHEEDRAMIRPEGSADAPADQSAIDREQAEALHAEVERLPTSSRMPVVLCYFEGLSLAEAAERLRCPAGTVHSRLVRAREKLRRGLLRRGVALSGAAIAAALSPQAARAAVPPLLCDSTTRAAIAFAARHTAAGGVLSAPAAAMAREVLRTMLIHQLKLVAMTVMALAAIATGAGYLVHPMAGEEHAVRDPTTGTGEGSTPLAERPRPDPPTPPARMAVAGRVLDPDGRPVKGAVVELVSRPRSPLVGARDEIDSHALLGQGRSDVDGRFRLDAPRTASTRVFEVYALASAPGYGSAAPSSIPTPNSPRPRSGSSPSNWSAPAWST